MSWLKNTAISLAASITLLGCGKNEEDISKKPLEKAVGEFKPKDELPPVPGKEEQPARPNAEQDISYKVDAAVKCENTAVYALAKEYLRVFTEYRKLTGRSVPGIEAQVYQIERMAGADGLQSGELAQKMTELDAKIKEAEKELAYQPNTITDEDTFKSSIEVKISKEDANRLDAALNENKAPYAYRVHVLKSASTYDEKTKQHSMSKEQTDLAIEMIINDKGKAYTPMGGK
jgi:hypothetical protein